jgi:hypothetical protein
MVKELGIDEAVALIEKQFKIEDSFIDDFIREHIAPWVPQNVLTRCRSLLVHIHQWNYNKEEIEQWLDRFETIGEEQSEWFYPAEYPSGEPLHSDLFIDTLGELAYYRWASDLEVNEGLKLLGGEYAVHGYKNLEGLRSRTYKKNRLTRLIIKTICALLNQNTNEEPAAEKIISGLSYHDDPSNRIIEEIDGEVIAWIDDSGKGNETALSTLPSKISRLKKDIKSKKVICGIA